MLGDVVALCFWCNGNTREGFRNCPQEVRSEGQETSLRDGNKETETDQAMEWKGGRCEEDNAWLLVNSSWLGPSICECFRGAERREFV